MPEFPERFLDQVLNDREALDALADYARRCGIEKPIADMSRAELSRLAGALMEEAGSAQQAAASSGGVSASLPEVPDGLTEAVFADPNAQQTLKDLALAHGWTEPPAELPDNAKRMFISILMSQGVIRVEASSEPAAAANPRPDTGFD